MRAVIENLSVDLNEGMLFVNVIRDGPARAGVTRRPVQRFREQITG